MNETHIFIMHLASTASLSNFFFLQQQYKGLNPSPTFLFQPMEVYNPKAHSVPWSLKSFEPLTNTIYSNLKTPNLKVLDYFSAQELTWYNILGIQIPYNIFLVLHGLHSTFQFNFLFYFFYFSIILLFYSFNILPFFNLKTF